MEEQLQEDIESNAGRIDDAINESKKMHKDRSNKLKQLLEENSIKLKKC